MRSICFFSSFYTTESIPNYVKYYLEELARHFSEIIYITNEKQLLESDALFLEKRNIAVMLVKNEGFDFGMWYKAFQQYDVAQYDRIGLINDSCILYNKLDFYFEWLDKQDLDYSGMTDCDLMKFHIQSYFIIINKRAIAHTLKYFEANGIISEFMLLIKIYEVGLSTYLLNAGMKLAAYYSFQKTPGIGNPAWMRAKNLIRAGYPLIKKKIMIRHYGQADWRSLIANGFDPYPNHYIRLIKKTVPGVKIEELLSDLPMRKPFKKELNFAAIAAFFRVYALLKKIKQLLRKIILFVTGGKVVKNKALS